jgi:hypothetical protein
MKICILFILYCFCHWIDPWLGHTSSDTEFIERYPLGQINWTRGIVTAPIMNNGAGPQDGRISDQAVESALQNMVNTLMQLRIDDQRCVAHIIEHNRISRAKVEAMVRSAKMIYQPKEIDKGRQALVQMSLRGGLAQLMLPSEIRQVQPIKALNGTFFQPHSKMRSRGSAQFQSEPGAYTGLIVDARGTGAKPSMAPSLLDEKGREVFGAAYVSREFAVQYGFCLYLRSMPDEWSAFGRVTPNPLNIKGLRTYIPDSCKIVISNADASRLRGTSAHLDFLKQCRVIIVLNE